MNSSPRGRTPAPVRTGAAYFGTRFLSHAERDLAVLSGACDYVVHTASETDLYYHKAALAKIFEATRKRGLEVWVDPWGLGGVFGGEALSKFLLEHPDLWQKTSDGRRVPVACLNQPVFRSFVKEWLIAVRHMGAEVVFWDEPHVYFHWDLEIEGVYACLCQLCKDIYRRTHGGSLPNSLDDGARDFRRSTLAGFLKDVMAYAKHKGLKNALCLYAFEGHKAYDQIWKELSSLPDLDVFGCDPYWRWRPKPVNPAIHVKHYAEKVVKSVSALKKGSQVWIQAMRLPKGTEGEIRTACKAAVEAGVTHLAAWSYDGGALLDPVLSERPEKVWEAVAGIFKELKG